MNYVNHSKTDTGENEQPTNTRTDTQSANTKENTFNVPLTKLTLNDHLKVAECNLSLDADDSLIRDYESDNVILNNIYGLFECISRRLDDSNTEIYERLLFLLNVGKLEDAKQILRFRTCKSGRVERWCKSERMRCCVQELRALVEQTRAAHAECAALVNKVHENVRDSTYRMQEMNAVINTVCSHLGIERDELTLSIQQIANEYTTLKQNARIEFDNTNKNLAQENERLKSALKALKTENTEIRNELVILSNEFYKSKQLTKQTTQTLAKQKRIIDILQEKLTLTGRETNYTIVDDLRFRIALLRSRIDGEVDGEKKRRLVDSLVDYEKRLSDFLSVDGGS
ncbi:hypothetical protein THOM_2091 [Trachipleistophora hominis]|uniref:Uncharacterized protein n=1 Tax=Trachipleistophora hominis TaxID=72359 RepID=L7JU62_TRAHO|nr:hypothetical protein THOM_2091 [Trachipleistophora hominis]